MYPVNIIENLNMLDTRMVIPFRPTDIIGLQLWLDAADATTLFQDAAKTTPAGNGDVVGAWADKSGNGKDALQATTAQKGTYQLGVINNLPVVRFDGTDDNYAVGDFSSLSGGEVFIVVKTDADPPPDGLRTGLWEFGTSTAFTHYPWTSNVILDTFGTTLRKTTVDPGTTLAQFNIYNVVSIANEWTSRLNNTQLFTTAINTVEFTAAAFLGANSTGQAVLDGDIAEVILYDAKLMDVNRALINNYLATKYGITIA